MAKLKSFFKRKRSIDGLSLFGNIKRNFGGIDNEMQMWE